MDEILEVSSPAGAQADFDLGKWLGRREAFGMIAGRCSAAEAECMERIRDGQLFKGHAGDWGEFCERFLHMSKSNANRLIALKQKFGAPYFYVAQFLRLSPASYCKIAPAVSPEGICYNGELIPFHEENSERIVAAVSALCGGRRQKPAGNTEEKIAALEAAADRLLSQLRESHRQFGADPYLTSAVARLERKFGLLALEIR